MSRVCVKAKPGASGSCVCDKYEDADTAFRVYKTVHRKDPRLNPRHPGHVPGLRDFSDTCRTAGLKRFQVGSTPVKPERTTQMSYADLPAIDDYAGADFGLNIMQTVKNQLPTKEEVINMVKSGGGVLAARLVSTQAIPRIPWLGPRFTSNIWWRVGTKVVLGLVAGRYATRLDGYFGAGMGAGFIGDAISDLVDHFIFKGSISESAADQAAEAAAEATDGMDDYSGDDDDDDLFLGDGDAADELFGDGGMGDDTGDDLFEDVDVMSPDALSIDGMGEIDIMKQFGPVGATHGESAGEWQGVDEGVGSWIQ